MLSDASVIAIMGVWSAIITGLFGVVLWLLNRPRHEAEAKQVEVQVYGTMLATMERMSVVLEQKETRLERLEKRQDELEALLRQKDSRIAELEGQMAELQLAMAAKDKQISDLNQLVISLQAEGEKKDQRIGELQEEIADLQRQRDDDRRRLDRLQQEKDRLEAEVALLRGEKDDTVEIHPEVVAVARAAANPPEQPAHIGLNATLVLTAPDAAIQQPIDGGQPS
ncbi:MAG: hypothetical protein DPW16_22140 [Chloroflexi bacterium]|nr:hypothetical protein [Chloroflexota bacterium]